MYLRALEPEDLEALYELETEKSSMGNASGNVPYSRYALREYILGNEYDIYKDRQVRHVIADDNGELLGLADLMDFSPRDLRAEVGIGVLTRFRKSGVGEQGLRLLMEYADVYLGLHQLYAYVNCQNTASIRLFEKVGFEKVAVLNDWTQRGGKWENVALFQLFLKK